ncbi:MAG: hypothetical protein A2583_04585 [Bdellovibrionales bacterium RIFOXYD1_FULL_53_11]|nr:MAG: hypothetical protein A2583_04585 [Bdellovibrionales bacterium RIFOXYD1_FULL_53_11]
MADTQHHLNILVVRTDNIGDVILSTPVLEALKKHFPHCRVTFMVRDALVPLVKGLPHVDEVMVYDPVRRHAGLRGFFRLVGDFRQRALRIAIVLHSRRRIAMALFGAGVRYRIGPLSKIHSFIFFNRGIRQRRSEVEMHETDYNLQLLRRIGIRIGTRTLPVRAHVSEDSREYARKWLEMHGWKPGEGGVVAVHPGMGGSALNWPQTHYAELIHRLCDEGRPVLVTGGVLEGDLLTRMREMIGQPAAGTEWKYKPMFFGGEDAGSVGRLAGLYSFVDVLVAPSTGPMHLAVALGKRVVTFYPPIKVQSAIRWGPYCMDEERTTILVPEFYCGEEFECRGSLCNYYPCMRSLSVMRALHYIHRQLEAAAVEERAARDAKKRAEDETTETTAAAAKRKP